MRTDLFLAVLPPACVTEIRNAPWFEWFVIGHENKDKVSRDSITQLKKEFWEWWDDRKKEYDSWDDWAGFTDASFLNFAQEEGYITFPPSQFHWNITEENNDDPF